jgi:hypothetical protein
VDHPSDLLNTRRLSPGRKPLESFLARKQSTRVIRSLGSFTRAVLLFSRVDKIRHRIFAMLKFKCILLLTDDRTRFEAQLRIPNKRNSRQITFTTLIPDCYGEIQHLVARVQRPRTRTVFVQRKCPRSLFHDPN